MNTPYQKIKGDEVFFSSPFFTVKFKRATVPLLKKPRQ